ncbi:DUF4266 domain-containing protein [Fluviicola sp.]|uniref:DUF4266 domain-containing protein n=1 Tax=Fluviicola sp. TaxID=1917219 RepID=UPI0031D2D550
MLKRNKKTVVFAALILTTTSCTIVKPYQMEYLNQKDMETNDSQVMKLENEAETYREGAAGGGGGKTGGGCGCN